MQTSPTRARWEKRSRREDRGKSSLSFRHKEIRSYLREMSPGYRSPSKLSSTPPQSRGGWTASLPSSCRWNILMTTSFREKRKPDNILQESSGPAVRVLCRRRGDQPTKLLSRKATAADAM